MDDKGGFMLGIFPRFRLKQVVFRPVARLRGLGVRRGRQRLRMLFLFGGQLVCGL